MILRASNIDNIDDFIDCAIFNIDYIAFNINILLEKGKKFGGCISSVPLLKNEIVLSINSTNEDKIDNALSICNIDILEFNGNINTSILAKYKKSYTICKYIDNQSDAKKYADYVDSFIVPYNKLEELLECEEISNHQIVVKATEDRHIKSIEDISYRNLVIDIDYSNDNVVHFIKNKSLTIRNSVV